MLKILSKNKINLIGDMDILLKLGYNKKYDQEINN